MNPNNDKPSFLDRGTLIAFAIILVFWFGWTRYMESQYPTPPTAPISDIAPSEQAAANTQQDTSTSGAETPAAGSPSTQETFLEFSDSRWSFRLSSKGMGLRDIVINEYKTRENEPVVLGSVDQNYPFSTVWLSNNQPVDFTIEQTAQDTFVGRGEFNGMQIEKTMQIDSSTYSVKSSVKVSNATVEFKGLATVLHETLQESEGGSFFAPSYDFQDWFVLYDATSEERAVVAKGSDSAVELSKNNVVVAAFSGHYFTLAIADESPLLPTFSSNVPANSTTALGNLQYRVVTPSDTFGIEYTGYAGPKKFDLLQQVNENLTRVINFGFFSIFARPILALLKYLHSVIGNWGWAIVVLTIIVRFIVLPFNVFSYRSMKAMQKIQPEMTRIRERYKDKPPEQRLQMNQEIMELMKRHKANPLGGCLPMLLQLPVFFALYQVLGQSIELYQAPFILWIDDLSLKDPFFVLPILMGITMFVQQKITPTTMDPQQAKIMMWMPVIFSLFMVSLPSGLTLYIFVSTLFGIIQQFVFMRDKNSAPSVKEAKA